MTDRTAWGRLARLVAAMVLTGVAHGAALDHPSERELPGIDPCTIPDLGPSSAWSQSNHWGFYVILTDLSVNPPKTVSVADGIVGHKSGEAIRLQIDIRDRAGSRPPYRVAVHFALSGSGGGNLRPVGKRYGCRSLWFFWSGSSTGGAPPSMDVVEYTMGSERRVAGSLPIADIPGKTRPLWAATQTIRISFGETDPAKDRQYRDGEVEYAARPEGSPDGLAIPNPFQSITSEAQFFGPNFEPGGQQVFRQASREYIAMRRSGQTANEVVLFGTTRDGKGKPVSVRQPIVLRRLGESDVFVGQVVLIPDGDPYEALGPRSPGESIFALPGGTSDFVIEED